MDDFATHNRSDLQQSPLPEALPDASKNRGVHGWLLVLCLMLTVIGPLISAWLVAFKYMQFAPYFASSRGLQVAILFTSAIIACSVVFGIYAGIRLWSIRPGAVDTAKNALLFGLAADILATAIQIGVGPESSADGRWFNEVTISVIPCLVFFTLCLGYLNKSTRVEATYEERDSR